MKNRGQVLIAFILILPLVLVIIGLVIEVGFNYIEKRKMDNVVKDSIRYFFNNQDNEDIESSINKMVVKNISDLNYKDINISNDYIKITINKKRKTLFPNFINQRSYELKTSYVGYMSDEKLIINKE